MKITIEITSAQAVAACKVIAELARTQSYFVSLHHKGADGPFAADGWKAATDREINEGIFAALASQIFGWTTSSGNQVKIWSSDGQWYVRFICRRHALLDTGNGVGQVFSALGGIDWAKTAYASDYETTTPEIEWYKTTTTTTATTN